MTTLRSPRLEEFSPDDRATLESVARRMGRPVESLLPPSIFGVQVHWPAWLEANFDHGLATYMAHGTLPQLVKEAMHVAVSMTNHCEY